MGEEGNNVVEALAKALGIDSSENNQNDGASDQTGGNSTTGDNGTEATDGQKQERVFTQDEVSRMMAREKHQGRNAVYNELGIDPDDTSAVQMFKAFVEAQKSDEEKRAENDAKQQAAMDDMSNKLKNAEAKAALMQAGISADYVDDAVVIALSRIAADDTLDVETVAKDLKAKYSVWFEGSKKDEPNKQSVGKRGTGKTASNGSGNATGKDSISGIGKRLAENRKSQAPKKSFWGE